MGPALVFHGEPFSDPANAEMQRLKNLLVDFFRGPEVSNIRLAGVEHVLQFTAVASKVKMRRTQLASEDLYKEACKQVANVHKKKKVKNISEDVFGTKHAKIHVDAQQIKTVQTRSN